MSRKTQRNANHRVPMELLYRKDAERMDRLKRGFDEETGTQRWVNRKGERGYRKERKKRDRAARNAALTVPA